MAPGCSWRLDLAVEIELDAQMSARPSQTVGEVLASHHFDVPKIMNGVVQAASMEQSPGIIVNRKNLAPGAAPVAGCTAIPGHAVLAAIGQAVVMLQADAAVLSVQDPGARPIVAHEQRNMDKIILAMAHMHD